MAGEGEDPEMKHLLRHALMGTIGLPVVVGALDAVTGPTTASNSGEVPANLLYSMIAPAAMAAAAGGLASVSPEAGLAARSLPIEVERLLLAHKARSSQIDKLSDIQALVNERVALDEQEQEVDRLIRDYIHERRKAGDGRYTVDQEGVQRVRRAGRNTLGAGALIAGLMGAGYAMNQMADPRN